MREDARQRATEFLQRLYAAGDIGAAGFDTGISGMLVARTDAELAEVVRSLPSPVMMTSPDRRLAAPLEIHSGIRRPLRRPARLQRLGPHHDHRSAWRGVQVLRHRGRVDSRLDPPVSGLPLIRLDVTANIGRVRLRHPERQDRQAGRRRR